MRRSFWPVEERDSSRSSVDTRRKATFQRPIPSVNASIVHGRSLRATIFPKVSTGSLTIPLKPLLQLEELAKSWIFG